MKQHSQGPRRQLRLLLLVLFGMCLQGAQTARDELTVALRSSVNWYRLWYGHPDRAKLRITSSDAWLSVFGPQMFVALPELELGVELDLVDGRPIPFRVEELTPGQTGEDAARRFVASARFNADMQTNPKANRFDLGVYVPKPTKPLAETRVQISPIGKIDLPLTPFRPAGTAERNAFLAYVQSRLVAETSLGFCKTVRGHVPRLGVGDPTAFVFVETSDCGSFLATYYRQGVSWRLAGLHLVKESEDGDLVRRIMRRAVRVLDLQP